MDRYKTPFMDKSRLFNLILPLITALSISACSTNGTLNSQPFWSLENASDQESGKCSLTSKPIPFITSAGRDNVRLIVDTNNLVRIQTQFEDIVKANKTSVTIHVDDSPPFSYPTGKSGHNTLIFNELTSKQLIRNLSDGNNAYLKITLPHKKESANLKLPLAGFHELLTKQKMCNIFTQ